MNAEAKKKYFNICLAYLHNLIIFSETFWLVRCWSHKPSECDLGWKWRSPWEMYEGFMKNNATRTVA